MQNTAAKLTMNMYWLSCSSAVGSLCIMALAFGLSHSDTWIFLLFHYHWIKCQLSVDQVELAMVSLTLSLFFNSSKSKTNWLSKRCLIFHIKVTLSYESSVSPWPSKALLSIFDYMPWADVMLPLKFNSIEWQTGDMFLISDWPACFSPAALQDPKQSFHLSQRMQEATASMQRASGSFSFDFISTFRQCRKFCIKQALGMVVQQVALPPHSSNVLSWSFQCSPRITVGFLMSSYVSSQFPKTYW